MISGQRGFIVALSVQAAGVHGYQLAVGGRGCGCKGHAREPPPVRGRAVGGMRTAWISSGSSETSVRRKPGSTTGSPRPASEEWAPIVLYPTLEFAMSRSKTCHGLAGEHYFAVVFLGLST